MRSRCARRRLQTIAGHTGDTSAGRNQQQDTVRARAAAAIARAYGDGPYEVIGSVAAAMARRAVSGRHSTGSGYQPQPRSTKLRLLDDAQMEQFVADGHITLPVTEHGPAIHAAIHARAEELFTTKLNYGNTRNIYPVIPELEAIMHGATVAGALTSALGPDYVMDRRKHMHNSSSQGDQRFHKDCQVGKSLTGHMPRCCMIFYIPGGCTEAMGPSEVLAGSHFLRTPLPHEIDTDAEVRAWDPDATAAAAAHLAPPLKLLAPLRRGTITMVHYDLVHRGTARLIDELTAAAPFRPMFKFLFNRTAAPTRPSWAHNGALPTPTFVRSRLPPAMRPVARSVWEWLQGSLPPPPPCSAAERQSELGRATNSALSEMMMMACAQSEPGSSEVERTGAAYTLGRRAWHGDDGALACLVGALRGGIAPSRSSSSRTDGGGGGQRPDPNAARAAVHGLGAAGDHAVGALVEALQAADGRAGRTAQAAEALGEACRTPSIRVVEALAQAMSLVRGASASAAGRLRADTQHRPALPTQAVAFCVDALKHLAQRLHAQLLEVEELPTHDDDRRGGVLDGLVIEVGRPTAHAILEALSAHPADRELVRECRGKALLSLVALPRAVWRDRGAGLASALRALAGDPSQYAMSMGVTGLARLARAEPEVFTGGGGGGVPRPGASSAASRARQAVLERMAELRYVALDNTGLH
jgi:hypothetical protein